MSDQTPDDATERAELAFRDALARAADGYEPAPLTRPTAPGRRRWLPALAAAAVLLVAGALAAVTLPGRGGTPAPVDPGPSDGTSFTPPPSDGGLPAGWHYESHLDAVVGVPDSWGYRQAPGDQWCVGGQEAPPATPYVDTSGPGTVSTDVLCQAQPAANFTGVPERFLATHLSFPDPATAQAGTETWNGWTQTTVQVGHALVSVLSDEADADVAGQVLATASEVHGDAVGCLATSPIQAGGFVRPDPAFDVTSLTGVDRVAICQYLLGRPGEPGLNASRELHGADAEALLAAVQDAAAGGGPDTPTTCVHTDTGSSAIVLRFTTQDVTDDVYVYYETCIGNGFDDGTTLRTLTLGSCRPLWGGRVRNDFGSSASYQTCHDLDQASGADRS